MAQASQLGESRTGCPVLASRMLICPYLKLQSGSVCKILEKNAASDISFYSSVLGLYVHFLSLWTACINNLPFTQKEL